MIDKTDDRQVDTFQKVIAETAAYTAHELAEKYGLSDGQARTLIQIHGPSRQKLDRVISAQPLP